MYSFDDSDASKEVKRSIKDTGKMAEDIIKNCAARSEMEVGIEIMHQFVQGEYYIVFAWRRTAETYIMRHFIIIADVVGRSTLSAKILGKATGSQ